MLNRNVIKPNARVWTRVMVGDQHRVVSVVAVNTVDMYTADVVISCGEQANSRISVFSADVSDLDIGDFSLGDLCMKLINGGERYHIVVGGSV